MAWERRRYRGNKVWVETGADGALVLDERGLARLRYKPDDDRTYSVRAREVAPLEGPGVPVSAPARTPPASRPPPGRAEPRVVDEAEEAAEAVAGDLEPGDDVPALAGLAVHVYTDGACSGNPGPAGVGVVLLHRERRREISRYLGETTNNVAELTAVLDGLRALRRVDLPVRLHTDSTYAIGVLGGTMRAKANVALVAEVRAEMARFPRLRLVKVPAHSGVVHNERADALARDAIRRHARRRPKE